MTVLHGHPQLPHCILLEAKTLPLKGAAIPGFYFFLMHSLRLQGL